MFNKKEYDKNWKLNNKEKVKFEKKKYRHKLYNFTYDDYLKIRDKQENLCGICGKNTENNGRDLAIDHCHKTGKVRGLLCVKCNRGIGLFDDDLRLLKKAILYLS